MTGAGVGWCVGGGYNIVVQCSDQDLKGNSEIIEFFLKPRRPQDCTLVSSLGLRSERRSAHSVSRDADL